jgi:hypothetical protein
LVKGTKKSLGLEAWRKLSRKFDPNNPVANLRLLRKILRPTVATNETLISSIEWWEQEYSRYADRTKETLSESMRKATLHAMCPPELANHLDLHIQRLDTYDLLKSEIERYMEQVVARTSGPAPMDIGSLHNEHKRKGKGKGHDKGNGGKNPGGKGHQAFDGDCNRCGRPGHKKTDCFAKTHKNGSALTSAPSKAPPPPKAKGGGKNGKKGNKKGKRGLHEITEGEGQEAEPEPVSYTGYPGAEGASGDCGYVFVVFDLIPPGPDASEPAVASVSSPAAVEEKVDMVSENQALYRALLIELYEQCNPEKVSQVDDMLVKYVNQEADFYAAVCWRYQVEEKDFPSFGQEASSSSSAAPSVTTATHQPRIAKPGEKPWTPGAKCRLIASDATPPEDEGGWSTIRRRRPRVNKSPEAKTKSPVRKELIAPKDKKRTMNIRGSVAGAAPAGSWSTSWIDQCEVGEKPVWFKSRKEFIQDAAAAAVSPRPKRAPRKKRKRPVVKAEPMETLPEADEGPVVSDEYLAIPPEYDYGTYRFSVNPELSPESDGAKLVPEKDQDVVDDKEQEIVDNKEPEIVDDKDQEAADDKDQEAADVKDQEVVDDDQEWFKKKRADKGVYVPPALRKGLSPFAINEGSIRGLEASLATAKFREAKNLEAIVKTGGEAAGEVLNKKIEDLNKERETIKARITVPGGVQERLKGAKAVVKPYANYSDRLRSDVAAGHTFRAAKRKEQSRIRMSKRRIEQLPGVIASKLGDEKAWHQKHDVVLDDGDFVVSNSDQAGSSKDAGIEDDAYVEIVSGNAYGGSSRIAKAKVVTGKLNKAYRPLNDDELRDCISNEQDQDDKLIFKARNWDKPQAEKSKSFLRKAKDKLRKKQHEELSRQNAGLSKAEFIQAERKRKLRAAQSAHNQAEEKTRKLLEDVPWRRKPTEPVVLKERVAVASISSPASSPRERTGTWEAPLRPAPAVPPGNWEAKPQYTPQEWDDWRNDWRSRRKKELKELDEWDDLQAATDEANRALAKLREKTDRMKKRYPSPERDGDVGIITGPQGEVLWENWKHAGCERLDIVVDSGASTSILPQNVAKLHPLDTSKPSKTYTSASKQGVTTVGEKTLLCGFQNGERLRTKWEVADVHRPLCSVSKMVRNGYQVWFASEDDGGCGAWHPKTKQTLKIYEKGGVFVLPAWVQPEPQSLTSQGFARPAVP